MPRLTTGSVFRTGTGYGIRWPEEGGRPQRIGFKTKTEARRWFAANVAPRLDRGAPSPDITFDGVLRPVPGPPRRDRQRAHPRDARGAARTGAARVRRLDAARARGRRRRHRPLARRADRHVALPADAGAPSGARRRRALALHDPQPGRRRRPQPGAAQRGVAAVHARRDRRARRSSSGRCTGRWSCSPPRRGCARTSGPRWSGATSTAPGPAVLVQRRYADGVATPYPKTGPPPRPADGPRGRRARPAAAAARHAVAVPGGPGRAHRPRHLAHARVVSGARRRRHRQRGPYQLRHTFATEALAAGISIFELARVMGTSVQMIDRTYGHLARDSEQAIRARLDARSARSGVVVAPGAD